MPLQIIRQDITKIKCDAIVNAANKTLLGGGGVDGAIHRAAGPQLKKECAALGGCNTGEAKITKGYKLPSKYVIHTVGPIWRGGAYGEDALLRSCYKNSLALAKLNKCESIAFPLISAGAYGFPVDGSFRIAVEESEKFLFENDMLIYIVVFDKRALGISSKLFSNIEEYIDDNYVDAHRSYNRSGAYGGSVPFASASMPQMSERKAKSTEEFEDTPVVDMSVPDFDSFIDESFSSMLLRKIDESGMKDSECYKKANIDRKLFSKIRSNPNYKPSKATALAFAIALELSLEETKELLLKAGFALSHSYKFDVIVEYFIKNKNYNLFEINEVLFAYDQTLLGST